MYYKNPGYKIFNWINLFMLFIISLLCIFPVIHILALSFSSAAASSANLVSFFPVGFTTEAYAKTLQNSDFLSSLTNSIIRVILGVGLGMLITVLTAYPLSKMDNGQLKGGRIIAWYFVFTMLFSGGLIPSYIVIQKLGLINSIWALILPGLVGVWNIILMLNFFRAIPKELEEACFMDGAGHIRILFNLYIPLSLASIATLSLFIAVGHWNSWFDGIIYLSNKEKWPISTLLQTLIVSPDPNKLMNNVDPGLMENFSARTVKAAQIFIGSLPILIVYPFLQRFFIKGIVMGSIKE